LEYPIQPRPNDREVVAAPPPGEAAHCEYCGAPLSQFFYFCLACGTPYKAVNSVITPHRPRILTDGELVERKAPQVHALFWSYFGTLFAIFIVTKLAFREDRPDLEMLIADGMLLVLTCVWGWIHRAALKVQFTRFGFNHPAAYAGLAMLVPLLAINYGYHTWLESLMNRDGEDILDDLRTSGVGEAILIVSFCVMPAIVEEIAFRGLVQHWLQAAIRPRNAIIYASFLFTVMHLSILSFPYLFAVGALLGWTKWKTGSLYPSMLIHFLHNFVVIEYFENWR
jgi:membrane protease YdiL (CAAX protease family)